MNPTLFGLEHLLYIFISTLVGTLFVLITFKYVKTEKTKNIILKVVAVVELLVPAYGYCEIPPCDNFSDSTCDAFFSLPLFPETFGGGCCCCDD